MKRISTLLFAATLAAAAVQPAAAENKKATFAAGCFWCLEEAMDKVPGVVSTTSGYIGGTTENPSYEQVSTGGTGHTEAVEVVYDPGKVSYETLLDAFWKNHDPTVTNRQFCDVGTQYRPGIFYHDAEQKRLAEASKAKVIQTKPFPQKVHTPIEKAGAFWPAEDYHQDYYKKNPARYTFYVTGCGRYRRLEALWGKP
ncbi:MAG: peptide-methionine (S)-S-oxide reductase MsrA [Burkholderiales bacterium]|nr:peptide-methionine (S)-S-oxide reductase MsrA [Burkholderiales bacterium]